jgi:hypothetical protein
VTYILTTKEKYNINENIAYAAITSLAIIEGSIWQNDRQKEILNFTRLSNSFRKSAEAGLMNFAQFNCNAMQLGVYCQIERMG